MTRGEALVLRLSGDLLVHPAFLMEGDALRVIRAQIKLGAGYDAILAALGEVI